MHLRRFLKKWSLREMTCAAGLAVLSAGAGYCLYRSLRRETAPPDHARPPHELVDVLEKTLSIEEEITASVLQVIEPILQMLPTEPHNEPSAVCSLQRGSAPPDHDQPAHEPVDVLKESQVRNEEGISPSDLQVLQPNLQLLLIELLNEPSAVRSLQRGSAPPDHTQPPQEPCFVLEEPYRNEEKITPSVLLVIEPNLQLLPTEPHDEPSAFVLPPGDGELTNACYDFQFLYSGPYSSQSMFVFNKGYFLAVMRGPESRLSWFKTKETCYLNHNGFPYHTKTELWFTAIQRVSGRVTEFFSCNRMESAVNVPLEDYVQTFTEVTCTYLHVGPDGQEDSATWVQGNTNRPPYDSENQPDAEECEESFTPEEMEVPFISSHLADRGICDIGLKLCALREAFSTLLASIHNQNFLFVVGKKIVMRLAADNNQDVASVQLAYESLIRFLRRPCNQDSIVAELSAAQIQHYNFIDVFFELLLFGYFENGSAPGAFEGGFLERLYALISMWDMEEWEPAAEQYFTVLIEHLTVFCEVLFSPPLELYSDPAALSSAVLHLLRDHVQLMMDNLERL